jgi:hypothetical protein
MTDETNDDGYRGLWAAVLYQAISDMDSWNERRPAIDWVFSEREDEGSMRWICDMLDLDYYKLQNLSMTREGRSKILKKGVPARRAEKVREAKDLQTD